MITHSEREEEGRLYSQTNSGTNMFGFKSPDHRPGLLGECQSFSCRFDLAPSCLGNGASSASSIEHYPA
jgi:hypothetical protein